MSIVFEDAGQTLSVSILFSRRLNVKNTEKGITFVHIILIVLSDCNKIIDCNFQLLIAIGQARYRKRDWTFISNPVKRACFAKSTRSYRHRSPVNRCHSYRGCHSCRLTQLDGWCVARASQTIPSVVCGADVLYTFATQCAQPHHASPLLFFYL